MQSEGIAPEMARPRSDAAARHFLLREGGRAVGLREILYLTVLERAEPPCAASPSPFRHSCFAMSWRP